MVAFYNNKLIHEIMGQYNIGQWEVLKEKGVKYKSLSLVKKIRCNNQLYILKKLPSTYKNTEHLEHTLFFQEKLRANNIPVPFYAETNNNKLYSVITHKNQQIYYTMQNFVDGERWVPTTSHIKNIGKFLVNFHNVSKHLYENEERILLPEKNIFSDIRHLINIAYNELESKIDPVILNNNQYEIIEFLAECKNKLNRIEAELINTKYNRNVLYVHGDFHTGNLIFKNEQIVGVVDFDNCGIDDLINDIARFFLHIIYFRFDGQVDFLPSFFTKDAWTFFNAYMEESNILNKDFYDYFILIVRAIAIELGVIYILRGIFKELNSCNKLFQLIYHLEMLIIEAHH